MFLKWKQAFCPIENVISSTCGKFEPENWKNLQPVSSFLLNYVLKQITKLGIELWYHL